MFEVDQHCLISSCSVLYEQVTHREPTVARALRKVFLYSVNIFHKQSIKAKETQTVYFKQKKCIFHGKHRIVFLFPFGNLNFQPKMKFAMLINIILNKHFACRLNSPKCSLCWFAWWWRVCPGDGSSPDSLQHFISIKGQSFSCWSQELIPTLAHWALNWAQRMHVAIHCAWKHTWDVRDADFSFFFLLFLPPWWLLKCAASLCRKLFAELESLGKHPAQHPAGTHPSNVREDVVLWNYALIQSFYFLLTWKSFIRTCR